MELFGLLEASLAEKEISPSDDLVDLINKRINPPKPVTKDEVYIRTMFLVSDQINSYGGRFPQEELAKIVELVIDSPVMVGHKKEKLPIARNFKAELVEKDNVKWVKVWFYWLKSAEGALSLKENIDHGIYKECSVAFLFELPECSICKEDMRKCPHIPFKNYPIADNQDDKPCTSGVHSKAYFNYRGINQVLETSLVYRGAVPNTSISDELSFYRKEKIIPLEFVDFNYPFVSQTHSNIFFHLEDLSSLGGEFLVEPLYQGIRAQIHKSNQEVRIFDKNGNEISQKFPSLQNAIRQYDKDFILDGEIVKYRGKSRIPRQELFEYLFNSTSRDDFGFRFKLFDILYLNSDLTFLPLEQRKKIIEENFEDNSPVQKVRYQKAEANDLPSFIRRISSSEGAVIKLISSSYFSPQSWWLYKKNLEIDCLVKKVEKNKGGTYNYLCAISRNPEVKPKLDTPEGCAIESQDGLVDLGTTYSTHLEAKVGDVICVHADMIEKSQNGYRWVAPKVMEVRKDKNCSDSFSILERMCSCGLNLTSRSSEVKLKLDTPERDANSLFEHSFKLVRVGGSKTLLMIVLKDGNEVGFGLANFDLEKINKNRKFLLKRLENIPVQDLEILDKGGIDFPEKEDDRTQLHLSGKMLNGVYRIVPIRFKGERRYLFFKGKLEYVK